MISCEEIQDRILLGEEPHESMARHVLECPRCQQLQSLTGALVTVLARDVRPDPPMDLSARVLAAARPELTARRGAMKSRRRWALGRAMAAAVAPLPLIVGLDAYVLRSIHAALNAILPAALSTYVVYNYALLVGVLITLTYAAVPLLAERQTNHLRRPGPA